MNDKNIDILKDAVDTLLAQSGEFAGLRAYMVWRALKDNMNEEMIVDSENYMGGIGGAGIISVLHNAIDPDDEEFWALVKSAKCDDGWFDERKFFTFLTLRGVNNE